MFKNIILSFALAIIAVHTVHCQIVPRPPAAADTATQLQNSLYAEFLGPALFGVTVNYERFLSNKPGGLSLRAGFGIGTAPGWGEDGVNHFNVLPLSVQYNLPISPNKRNQLELGALYAFVLAKNNDGGQYMSPVAGWRYQSASGRLQLRATVLLFIFSPTDESFSGAPWLGVSIGTKF